MAISAKKIYYTPVYYFGSIRYNMSHTKTAKTKLLTRIRRIKGQSIALEKSLEGEPDCMEFLQQIAAIKGAVNGLMKEVLEDHLREHLGAQDIDQQQRQDEVEQVILILKSYMK
tara:strand:+ start:566 stop:907 length:342 start_codon:yes stop_codon:yes gene_type:complete